MIAMRNRQPITIPRQDPHMVDLIARNATRLESVVRFTDVLLLYAMGVIADALLLPSGSTLMSATHTAILYFCCMLAVVVFHSLRCIHHGAADHWCSQRVMRCLR